MVHYITACVVNERSLYSIQVAYKNKSSPMTQTQYRKIIEHEIQKLNREIDFKIIRGHQYSDDSRRHKILLAKLEQQRNKGFLNRVISSTLSFI